MSDKVKRWKVRGVACCKWMAKHSFVLCSAVVVVVLLSILGCVGVIAWNRSETDKSYATVVGACVTGAVTLIGIAVATFVLRFQIKSQTNPFKLENEKSLAASLKAVCGTAGRLHTLLFVDETDTDKDREERGKAIDEARTNFRNAVDDNAMYLPNDVFRQAIAFWINASLWRDKFVTGGDEEDMDEEATNAERCALELHRLCRLAADIEVLNDETRSLMKKIHGHKN